MSLIHKLKQQDGIKNNYSVDCNIEFNPSITSNSLDWNMRTVSNNCPTGSCTFQSLLCLVSFSKANFLPSTSMTEKPVQREWHTRSDRAPSHTEADRRNILRASKWPALFIPFGAFSIDVCSVGVLSQHAAKHFRDENSVVIKSPFCAKRTRLWINGRIRAWEPARSSQWRFAWQRLGD